MKNTSKGFAGLGNKVSDVSDIDTAQSVAPTLAPKPQAEPLLKPSQPQASASAASTPRPEAHKSYEPTQKDDSKATKTAALFWGTVAVIVFAFWVMGDGSSSRSRDSVEVSSLSGDYGSPATEEVGHSPTPAQAEVEQTPARPENMPAIAQGAVLNMPEIRWCKRRQIELESVEGILDGERQKEVAAYNDIVEDYNSRCGNFRYRRGNVEQVDREFEPERARMKSEAQSGWVRFILGLDKDNEMDPEDPEIEEAEDHSASRAPENPRPQKQIPSTQSLNSEERQSLESSCSSAKLLEGPAAYARCKENQLAALADAPRNINLSGLNGAERESIQSSCSQQKLLYGPAAYNQCLTSQIEALKNAPRNIDLSGLNRDERESIQSSCSQQKLLYGPAAYNQCLSSNLAALNTVPRNIDLSGLNRDERASIQSSCSQPKLLYGPAAYNECLSKKLAAWKAGPRNIDLSSLKFEERESIKSACSTPHLLEGPAAYNQCLTNQLKQLRS
ncbi:hypothetical protein LE190_10930 [Massilia oculi]|uniref:Uncharacterized protein n=1 Tax=Massilia hydrophila TaxID=3044279 RepID=A0ABS7YDK3_9BURK|nr:hypothetical protein [Massilia oculi]MCA1856430.1 hypothetical protein [Massilia oculi]